MAPDRGRPAPWIVVTLGIAVVVVAYLIGSDLGGPAPTPSSEPTTSVTAAPSQRPPSSSASSSASSSSPTPSADASSPAPSSPTPSPSEPAVDLTGDAALTDPVGDVTGEAGDAEPDGPSAADVATVALSGDGRDLAVEMTLAGDVPTGGESVLWSVELWADNARAYTVSFQQVGTRLFAAVFDWSDESQQELENDAAQLDGRTLSALVPADLVPDLTGDVSWWASTQRDGGYEDRIPDAGADARASFPG